MDLAFYLRFVGAALVTALVVLAGALLTGSGIPGTIDGMFLIGMVAALISVLFTRPSVFRKRAIRRTEEAEDEQAEDPSSVRDPDGSDDGGARRQSGENDGGSASAPAGGRRRVDSQVSDSGNNDPARKIRIGLGLIAYAGVLLTLSAVLHLFAL